MNFVSYVALYLLLFDLDMPFLRGIGSAPFAVLISAIVICLNLSQAQKKAGEILKEFNYLSILFLCLLIFAMIRIILDGAEDVSYLGTSLKGFGIFVSSLLYLIAFNTENIFSKLINVFFINALIALIVGTFQELQPYINLFKPNGGAELRGWTPYRNAFFAGSGYFGIGAPFAVAIVFFMTQLLVKLRKNILNNLKLLFIIIAGVFAARTVFICIAVAVVYLLFIKRSVYTLIVGSVLSFIIFFVLNMEMFRVYQIWLFEIFDKGVVDSDTGAVLFYEFVKIPDNFGTFFFGDGKYVDSFTGDYYMSTDIGYLRHWFFGGIFFMLAVLLIPFLMYVKNKNHIFLFVIIPVCLILHFKGVFIYNNPVFTPLLIIISHIFYIQRQEREKVS